MQFQCVLPVVLVVLGGSSVELMTPEGNGLCRRPMLDLFIRSAS